MRSGSSHEDKFLILSIVKAHSWNIQKALFWDGSVCTLAALGRPCISKRKSWSYPCKSMKLCGAALIASKFFCIWTIILETRCWKCGSMKVQEAGKSEAKKVQWDLGTEVGVSGSIEISCLSSEVITLYNPFNECIKHFSILKLLSFPPQSHASCCHLKFVASSDPFILMPMLTFLQ